MSYVKTFVRKTHKKKTLVWLIEKTIFSLSLFFISYIFWLLFDRVFYMTTLEKNLFLLTSLVCFIPFLFGKPNLSSTVEFIERKITGLKGRLYLIVEPFPSSFDSENYRKKAIKESTSLLKRQKIKDLAPLKIESKYLKFFCFIVLLLICTSFFTGGLKLSTVPERPILVYAKGKTKENQDFLVKAKSNKLRKMYLFSAEGTKEMVSLGKGNFAVITSFKKTSDIQVGYRVWKSKKKKIEIIPTLLINKLTIRYKFPDYLESKSFSDTLTEFENDILIQALEGTQIEFSGISNLSLDTIKGTINRKSVAGNRFFGSFIVKNKRKIGVELVDSSQFCSYTFNFFVDPIKDEPPRIEFIYPREEYKVDDRMEVPVILQAEDDYALFSSALVYGKEKKELFVNKNKKFFIDSLILDVGNLLPGDLLELKATATDFAGNTTVSSPILIYVPTLEEILGTYKDLSDTLKERTVNFEETEKEIAEKIENFLYKNELGRRNQQEIKQTLAEQKQLIEEMGKLAEITEKINSPELADEIRHIEELLNNPQIKEFLSNLNKIMENKNISGKDLNRISENQTELLETLELFEKSLEYLKQLLELNEFSGRAQEILEKQQRLTSSAANEELSKMEKELKEELGKLIDDMEKSSDLKTQAIASDFKKTKTTEKMENLANSMQKGEINQGKAKEIEENLRNLNMSLNALRQNRSGKEIQEVIRKKGWELGFILRTHNNLIGKEPSLLKGLIEQGLLEALTDIEKDLEMLFLKTLAFSPEVFGDIKRAKKKMKQLSIELTQKEVPRSSMERVNDLIIQAILKLFSPPPPNNQSLANAINQIIQQQNALMQGLGNFLPLEIPSKNPGGDLKSFMEKQKQLAEDLREMGKAFGPLSAEMEAMADDLAKGKLDKQLIERQKKVLDRLLEAEKAIREGETSRRRRSEPGIFVRPGKVSLPTNLGEKKKKLRELLEKRIGEPYPREYKKEIEEYFRKLIE